jgi:hypothetical protein
MSLKREAPLYLNRLIANRLLELIASTLNLPE